MDEKHDWSVVLAGLFGLLVLLTLQDAWHHCCIPNIHDSDHQKTDVGKGFCGIRPGVTVQNSYQYCTKYMKNQLQMRNSLKEKNI